MTDAFTVPELTRGLRSFASPRSWRAEQDRFFAPLLDARRAAARATRWSGRLAAFDAERIEATMRSMLGSFAAEQYPHSAPDRRAVTAQLEDACAETFAALERLATASVAVQATASDDARAARWDAWVAALAATFAAADRDWAHVEEILPLAVRPSPSQPR
jgi:hypothetical protein